MNLKTRLKKLEDVLIEVSTENCLCNGTEPKIEFRKISVDYDTYSTGKYVPYQDSETAKEMKEWTKDEQPTPENCPVCGKPVNKRLIILSLVG